MTSDEKRSRLERIKHVNEARQSANEPCDLWYTRNTILGTLANDVNVWCMRPSRKKWENGDVVWYHDDPEAFYTCLSLVEAMKWIGNGIPDNDRECTKVDAYPPKPEV